MSILNVITQGHCSLAANYDKIEKCNMNKHKTYIFLSEILWKYIAVTYCSFQILNEIWIFFILTTVNANDKMTNYIVELSDNSVVF